MDLSTTQLREREAIATAAMREAGRLAAAGGAGAAAAAQRLRDSMARLGTIRAELAARAEREAPAQPAAVEVPAPAEIHAPPPASEPERDEIAEAVERLAEATDVAETAARDVRLRQAIARAWRGVDRAKAQQASASWLRPGSQREADAAHEEALNKVRAAAATACTAGQANTHNRQHNAVALESSRAHAELAEEERERRAKHVADLQRAQQKARDAASLAAANRDLAARVEADKAKADAERGAEAERRRLAATQPVKPTPARPTTPPRHHYPIPGVRRRD